MIKLTGGAARIQRGLNRLEHEKKRAGKTQEMKSGNSKVVTKGDQDKMNLIEELNQKLSEDRPLFEIIRPGNFTVKTRQGKFYSRAFSGGDSVNLESAYVGKKDLIYIFKPTFPSAEYAFIEMTSAQAASNLDGFVGYIEEVQNDTYDQFVTTVKKDINPEAYEIAQKRDSLVQVEKDKIEKKRQDLIGKSFPHYGSW